MAWRDAEREFEDPVLERSTIPALFEAAARRHENRPAQQYKGGVYDRSMDAVLPGAPEGQFRSIPYSEVHDVVRHLATGLRDLGVEAGTRVGIFANTRMEWAQTDFAVLAAGGVVTTVYASSSERQVRYLLSDAGADGVVVEDGDALQRVLAVEDDLDLEFIVLMDRPTGEAADAYEAREDVHLLAEVHDRGAELFDPEAYRGWVDERDPEDLCSLIYTSGTTGKPKGVRLTHRNFASNVHQVYRRFGPRPDRGDEPTIDEETVALSYLPLAHVFERLSGHFLLFSVGACVAYAEHPDTLREDLATVRPSTVTSVPRVYEKVFDAIREQASESDLRERVFEWAIDVGRRYHRADDPGIGLRTKRAAADRLVFSTVREALGGNLELLISGGGSLSPELCGLYHGMGLPVLEGYGLTETSPVLTVNPPEEPKVGTIGPPVVGVDVRVDDSVVADGEFLEDEGEVGELLVQGPNVTDGYWNRPEATEEAFDEDDEGRWFRTGDVVHVRPDGYLEFRERAKQILVLSTGKNVAPGPIEDAFASSEVVEQCMVVGDDRKFVGALIVPNVEGLRSWADGEGIDLPADLEAVCEHERVRERIGAEVDRVNREFEDYERIKRFALVPEEFTEDNGLLTPTMKKRRSEIRSRYEAAIESIYEEPGGEPETEARAE